MPVEQISEPGADWVPLHQAPFRFFPNFAPTPDEVRRELLGRLTRVLSRLQVNFRCYEDPDYVVVCEGEGLYLSIDADGGTFDLSSRIHDNLPIVFGRPHAFLGSYDDPELSSYKVDEKEAFREIARSLTDTASYQLAAALKTQAGRVMARVGSLVAPFQHIPLDAWRGFKPVLRDADADVEDHMWDAIGTDGTRLFSIFVAPHARLADPSPASSSAAERDCFRWLKGLMQHSDQRTNTKDALRAEALGKFKGLSKVGFNRMWHEAIENTGAYAWKDGGRPSKSKTLIPDAINH
ncbi:hypothetical protein Q8W71_15510 [Methylobacterium sp. NEAU 140]|uniref:hypothetical protein n=1 Tax=Methylobacterium sp. NEAU 140 TaxID=3064945 RepID=UPI002735C835|nr:hypothetical protein [Methylobacterium sp. NEAU 140]MDP4024036.1 hypothetical protein [Methylobacterium sp. NEAU 140]